MRYIFFIIILLLQSASSFSQTKIDTEEWIKVQVEEYHYRDKFGFNNYEISFNKGFMIVKSPIGNEVFYQKIPLQSVSYVKVRSFKAEEREGIQITLKCKGEIECIESGTFQNERFISSPPGLPLKQLYLDKSFNSDNLPARLEKALKHLIELNGGKLINNTF